MLERAIQWVDSLGMRMVRQKEPVIIPSLEEAIPYLKKEEVSTLFIATTKGFIQRKTLESFFTGLQEAAIHYVIYTEINPDPLIEEVERGVSLYQRENCQAIFAVGGGSVIDASKLIGARLVCPEKSIQEMKGLLKVRRKLPPLFAAPTTAGTGSEVTAAAVITGEKEGYHYKYAVSDPVLIPRYAILDPHLLLSLPQFMTATTGMDALTHAVEAYTNKFASAYGNDMAREAIRLIFENLEVSYNDPRNLEARSNMLLASYKAGIAFSHNFVGYVHALSHAMGGIYGLSHGYLNAVILPQVLEAYGASVYKKLAELADLLAIPGRSEADKAKAFIQEIKDINARMGIPSTLDELNSRDFDLICDRALAEGNPQYPVPELWNREDMKKVLAKLKGGDLSPEGKTAGLVQGG